MEGVWRVILRWLLASARLNQYYMLLVTCWMLYFYSFLLPEWLNFLTLIQYSKYISDPINLNLFSPQVQCIGYLLKGLYVENLTQYRYVSYTVLFIGHNSKPVGRQISAGSWFHDSFTKLFHFMVCILTFIVLYFDMILYDSILI